MILEFKMLAISGVGYIHIDGDKRAMITIGDRFIIVNDSCIKFSVVFVVFQTGCFVDNIITGS